MRAIVAQESISDELHRSKVLFDETNGQEPLWVHLTYFLSSIANDG